MIRQVPMASGIVLIALHDSYFINRLYVMTYTFIEYTGRIDFESGQNDFLFGQIVFQFGQNDRKPAFHHIFKSSHDL